MSKKKAPRNTYVVITPDGDSRVYETPDTIEEVLDENFAPGDFDPGEEFIVFDEKDGRVFNTVPSRFEEVK